MKKRELILRPDGCYDVPLTRGLFAIVDAEDAELVGRYNWCAGPTSDGSAFRAQRGDMHPSGERQYTLYLHAFLIYGRGPHGHGRQVDHRNHDPLDNRRANLRAATYSTNGANRRGWGRSGYKGVYVRPDGRFAAQIKKNKTSTHLGRFLCPVEAARAYDAAARVLHGEFAKLNFPADVV